jgi:nitrogen fixation NifU-like protein
MSDLRELYQSVILDHNKSPRNFGEPESSNHHADGDNPLCGDQISVHLALEDGMVRDVGFVGQGCAISTASASLMTEAVKGLSADDAMKLFDSFRELVTTKPAAEPELGGELGKLSVFAGVHEFPMRVKCATLAWHTLRAAITNSPETVSTE